MNVETTNPNGGSNKSNSQELEVSYVDDALTNSLVKNWGIEIGAFCFQDNSTSPNLKADTKSDKIEVSSPILIRFANKVKDILTGITIKLRRKTQNKDTKKQEEPETNKDIR